MAVAFRPPYSHSPTSRRLPLADDEPSHIIRYPPSADMPNLYSHSSRSGYSSSRYYDSADYYAEAASHHAPSTSTRYHAQPSSGSSSSIRRSSAVASSAAYEPPRRSSSMREHSSGMGGMFGMAGMAAAGAVAGAALTYTVLSRGNSGGAVSASSRAVYDEPTIPTFQRRSTFPDPYPPTYTAGMARYASQEGMRPSSRKGLHEVEELYEYEEGHGRHSSRQYRTVAGQPRGRARSEAPIGRAPLLLAEMDPRYGSAGSYVEPPRHDGLHDSSMYAYAPMMSSRGGGASFDRPGGAERESYVSARSHRSYRSSQATEPTVTVRGGSMRQATAPPNASRSAAVLRAASRSGSVSYRTGPGRDMPPTQDSSSGNGYGRAAREAPRSRRQTRWGAAASDDNNDNDNDDDDDDSMAFDDTDSVVPDDSISCVGVRTQRYR